MTEGSLPPRGDAAERALDEQRLADHDRRLAERDQALADREQELADLDAAAAPQPMGADGISRVRERARIAAERARIADERDRVATQRDGLADDRDRDARLLDEIRRRMQRDTLPEGHRLVVLADAEHEDVLRRQRAASIERATAKAQRDEAARRRAVELDEREASVARLGDDG